MVRGMLHEGYSTVEGEPKVHHGIGHYWCEECNDWVDGPTEGSYVDIISVDIKRGMAYVAFYYEGTGGERVATNMEVPLIRLLGYRGRLPDGPQTPWIRMYYKR